MAAKTPTRKRNGKKAAPTKGTRTAATTAAAPEAPPPEAGNTDATAVLDQVLGQVVRLMLNSPRHRHLFVADLEWMAMPAMALGQARLLRNNKGVPLAFACWARVSEEVEKRLEAGNPRLSPQDWRSGDRLWLIDVVAPDRALAAVVATLQKEVFHGEVPRTPFTSRRKAPPVPAVD